MLSYLIGVIVVALILYGALYLIHRRESSIPLIELFICTGLALFSWTFFQLLLMTVVTAVLVAIVFFSCKYDPIGKAISWKSGEWTIEEIPEDEDNKISETISDIFND